MSTSMTKDGRAKPKTTSTLSWVSDKLAAGAARVNGGEFQDIEVAVVKATNHDVVPPKEKHVRTLREVIATGQNRKKVVYIIHSLYERLVQPNETWLVILKTLMVFHKLMKTDGEATFKQEMVKYKEKRKLLHLMSLSNFRDTTLKENWDYSAFVRVYSMYLDERLFVFEQIGFDVEKETGSDGIRFRSATSQELLNDLPKVQKLLQRVLACLPEGHAAASEVVMEAMRWILTECFRLFRTISEGVISLAEHFFEMDRVDARKGLEMYKESVNSTSQMQTFFSSLQSLSLGQQIQFPQLQSPPEDFIEQMEEYVKGATGRTTTRKFPSTISRNARGAPSPAIIPGGQPSTTGTGNKLEVPIPEKSAEEQQSKEGNEPDLLNLDVLDLNDPVVVETKQQTVSNQDPFGEVIFAGRQSSNPGIPQEANVFMDDWNQQPVVATSPIGGNSGNAQEQGSSPFDDFFGGGPMAQPPPAHETSPPPPPAFGQTMPPPQPYNPQISGMQGGFGYPTEPTPMVFQTPVASNPFGDTGFQSVPQFQSPVVGPTPQMTYTQQDFTPTKQNQQQYSAHSAQYTGPGAFADPFDGLNPTLQKKTSFAAPGVPMRNEAQEASNPFGTNNTAGGQQTSEQQEFTSFF